MEPSFEKLWQFYLDTRFVYPDKFDKVKPYFQEIEDTWTRLLHADESIFKIYNREKAGRLKNSLAITRYYMKTWLIHHMASLADPAGMRKVLLYAITWVWRNKEFEYGKFYWRPVNKTVNALFTSLETEIRERGGAVVLREDFDYYWIPLEEASPELDLSGDQVQVRLVENSEAAQVSKALVELLGEVEVQVRSLDKDDLNLDTLDRLYRHNGLFRQRRVFLATAGDNIIALGMAEYSSLGLNFSFFLNKAQIIYTAPDLPADLARQATHKLMDQMAHYYRQGGRDFMVVLADSAGSPLEVHLGLPPTKQYRSLTISKSTERPSAYDHIKAFYDKRAPRPGKK